jgi:hypothetical protein
VPKHEIGSALLRMLSGNGERCVVVVGVQEVYMDEAGTHVGSPVLCVAAFIGDNDNWKTFLDKWGDQPFHAKENKYDKLKPELAKIIKESKLRGMVAWLNPKEFQEHAAQEVRNNLGNAYVMCAVVCALQIWKTVKTEGLGKIAFVLEKGQPNCEWVKRVLESMMDDAYYEGLVTSVTLANKRDFPQLATADFLANACCTVGPWCDYLLKTCNIEDCDMSPERLIFISEKVKDLVKWRNRLRAKKPRRLK